MLRWSDAREVPWRNGGGITRELHVEGGEQFDWRLSAATIASDGPFSSFPGIDRILVLLRGDGVVLRFGDDGSSMLLDHAGAACAFAGERPVDAALVGGPTVDLNLMWRRDRFDASVQDCLAAPDADVVVVHVLTGAVAVVTGADTVRLGPGDSAWWAAGDGVAAGCDDPSSAVVRFDLRRR